jgi:hypothetical protein
LQVREVNSGAAKREAREKLLEAARRREIDIVLVWRLDSRHEVLRFVSVSVGRRRRENHYSASRKSEFECHGRTMGSICQGRVSVEVDSMRREFPVAGAGGVQRNFSRRAKPSREGEQIAFPEPGDESKSRGDAVACRHRLGGLLKYYGRVANKLTIRRSRNQESLLEIL